MGIVSRELEEPCLWIAREVENAGGRALFVGGCVRDWLLGHSSKDVDMEVYGLQPEKLEDLLSSRFSVIEVGKAFGVFKIKGHDIDVSIPRRESKKGTGHKGFLVYGDPTMTHEEAAARRDFTVNAIMYDPLTEEWVDPYGGREDLKRRRLRHTSEKFSEDPLRVLRAMQFAARFDFGVAEETVELCRSIEPENLSRERIFEEWKKLIVKGRRPSVGLNFLNDCGWVRYYPELEATIGCEQDPEWHPEGDVWTHTLHCLDAFAGERVGDEWEDLVVGLGVLCHDLGKPATTKFEDGRIRSRGHEAEGEHPTRSFLGRMSNHHDLIEAVVPLVVNHLRPYEFYKTKVGQPAIRRLSLKMDGRIDRLVRVATADMKGRPPIEVEQFEAGEWLLQQAEELHISNSAPQPIIMGRHLIDMGLKPGPHFKRIIDHCYEEQLDGNFETLEEGLECAKRVAGEAEAPEAEK